MATQPNELPDALVLGYVRVSTDKQENGLEAQRKTIADLAERLQVEIAHVYCDEAVSGGLPFCARPQGHQLVDDSHVGDTVIVAKLDRLGRDTIDLLLTLDYFKRRDMRVFSSETGTEGVDSATASGRLMTSTLANVAEFERLRIGERTREALRSRRRQNLPIHGQPRIGWRRERVIDPEKNKAVTKWYPAEHERDQVREAWTRWRHNNEPLASVFRDFCRRGLRMGEGGLWNDSGEYGEKPGYQRLKRAVCLYNMYGEQFWEMWDLPAWNRFPGLRAQRTMDHQQPVSYRRVIAAIDSAQL